ncbi:hypothetical protein F5J12DRAFT_784206 [Pisolithus orientalis]|uniref:uncharacterized protein n=1 Tax=Pisolithus orientalis TaxID=936130 RepID=UPI00222427B3|nr:uncharacterized protein F5J12DRAFT_784206 [Pisolithus orientalis]KAI6000954.1 hypothetical protein F5J12DRAFT_784206 [Pisolithus orientalis]
MALQATPEQMPEKTVAHVPEHAMALQACQPLQSKFWSKLWHMCQSTPEQAMALWAHVLEHAMALWDKLWHASHSRANSRVNSSTCARACHGPLEHTATHVPEHTIAFQSTPEQAMALWNKLWHIFRSKLWHASHSGANSGANARKNCGTCARACHGPPEHTAAHVPEQTIAFWSTPE